MALPAETIQRAPMELLDKAERSHGREEKARGAIFTRPAVVDFMLDLIGYTVDQPLHTLRLLEPSFGGSRFILHAVDRLIESWRTSGGGDISQLRGALCAVELNTSTGLKQVGKRSN